MNITLHKFSKGEQLVMWDGKKEREGEEEREEEREREKKEKTVLPRFPGKCLCLLRGSVHHN